MANTIKGLTIEIGGDTTKLSQALSAVNAQTRTLQTELRSVNERLKLDPTNTELLAQKQSLLSQAIETTKGKLSTLKEAQVQVQAQFDKGEITEQQYNALQTEIAATTNKLKSYETQLQNVTSATQQAKTEISGQTTELNALKQKYTDVALTEGKDSAAAKELGQQIVVLSSDLAEHKTKLSDAQAAADKYDQSIKDSGNSAKEASNGGFTVFKGMLSNLASQAIQAVVSKLKELAQEALDVSDEYERLADVTGLSTDRLQEMKYIGDDLGVSLDDMTGSFKKLVKNMASAESGTGTAYTAFKKLGISVTDNNGQLRDSNDVWMELIDALGKVTNETERDALAQEILGKSATELNPLIKAGSTEMSNLATEAENTGAVMSTKAVKALDSFGDRLDAVKQRALSFVGEGLADIIGTSQTAAERMDDLSSKLNNTTTVTTLIGKYKDLSAKLQDTSLTEREVSNTSKELDQAKQDLIKASNGVVTQFDIENGTFDAQVAELEKLNSTERETLKWNLIAAAQQSDRATATRKINDLTEQETKVQEKANKAAEWKTYWEKQIGSGLQANSEQTKKATNEYNIWYGTCDKLKGQESKLSAQIAELNNGIEKSDESIRMLVNNGILTADEACTTFGLSMDDLNAILADTSTEAADAADTTSTSISLVTSHIQALETAYSSAKQTASDSINSQIGLFATFDGSAKQSIEDLTQTLLDQKASLDQYAANLQEAARRGVDEGLIAKLEDGSQESAQILASIVAGSDEEIAALNASFAGVQEGKDNFSGTVAEMATGFKTTWADLQFYADNNEPFYQAGADAASGYAEGVNSKVPDAQKASILMADTTTQSMRDYLDEHSPSRVTHEIGSLAGLGYSGGIDSSRGDANASAAELASESMSTLSGGINSSWGDVSSALDSTVLGPFGNMQSSVAGIIDDLKSVFNFSWSLPDLKLPHISISGSFSLSPLRVPHFYIDWYANGGILNAATIFGANGGNLMGGGEAGPEAVLPINEKSLQPLANVLLDGMAASDNGTLMRKLDEVIVAVHQAGVVDLDGVKVSKGLAHSADQVSGQRTWLVDRGLAV